MEQCKKQDETEFYSTRCKEGEEKKEIGCERRIGSGGGKLEHSKTLLQKLENDASCYRKLNLLGNVEVGRRWGGDVTEYSGKDTDKVVEKKA